MARKGKRARSRGAGLTRKDIKKVKRLPLPEMKYKDLYEQDNRNVPVWQVTRGQNLTPGYTGFPFDPSWGGSIQSLDGLPSQGDSNADRDGDTIQIVKEKFKFRYTMATACNHIQNVRVFLVEDVRSAPPAGTSWWTNAPLWEELFELKPGAGTPPTITDTSKAMLAFRARTNRGFRIVKEWFFTWSGHPESTAADVIPATFVFDAEIKYRGEGARCVFEDGDTTRPSRGKFWLLCMPFVDDDTYPIPSGTQPVRWWHAVSYTQRMCFRDA